MEVTKTPVQNTFWPRLLYRLLGPAYLVLTISAGKCFLALFFTVPRWIAPKHRVAWVTERFIFVG
jgi:hypothetical protein